MLKTKYLIFSLLISLCLQSSVRAGETIIPSLYVCGDSTAAKNKLPIIGWGEMLGNYLDVRHVHIENRSRGGRSARTFITEGLWASVRSAIKPGDIVIIQFGHNDTFSKISTARYDLPGLGDETQQIEEPKTKKPYKYIDYKSVLCLSTADELSKDLFDNWNIPSGAKSLILGPPNITNLDICLSYIKGIIIGDGTILATDLNGTDYCKISILGTEKLLSWIKSMFEIFLKKEMDEVSVRSERSGAKIFILCITGLKASRIIDKLNQLNTLQLDRKFKRPEILNIIKSDKEKNPDLF